MKIVSNTVYAIILSLCFFSCASDFYIPKQGNLLILQEKNDLKGSISFNSAQAAYSPINNLGLKADFSYARIRSRGKERDLTMGTIGTGTYFSKVVKPLFLNNKKTFHYPQLCTIGAEFYANLSLGNLDSRNIPNSGSVIFIPSFFNEFRNFRANILQPHLSTQIYWQSRTFTVNFGIRTGLIYYYNADAFGSFTPNEISLATDLIENTPFFITEYDIHIAKGNDHIQSFINVSWGQSFSEILDPSANLSFGFQVNISSFLQKVKHKKSRKRDSF